MNKKGQTPDERFLLELYRMSKASGDLFSAVEIQRVAKAICYKETAVKNIVNMLAQTNFITKISDKAVRLTPNGRDFVLNELQY